MANEERIIVCDTEKCSGCKICEYACAVFNRKSLNPREAKIIVVRKEPILNVAISCVLCKTKDCLNGCPTQAITFNQNKSSIEINADKCDACGLCIERCKFGCITMAAQGKNMLVCDFCSGQDSQKCVELCPKGALAYSKPDYFQAKVRQ
ncbi:MAG: 4Fe-4S binding protein [Candidatus Woesearchaeota archaeon]